MFQIEIVWSEGGKIIIKLIFEKKRFFKDMQKLLPFF